MSSAEARNWVEERCSTNGAGPLVLAGALQGRIRFRQAFNNQAAKVYYVARDDNTGYYEAGIGTFDGVDLITRDTPREIFAGGVYQRGSPAPIALTGNSVVANTMSAGAFNDLLQKADAEALYVPQTSTGPIDVASSAAIQLQTSLATLMAPADQPYEETNDPDSLVTVGNLRKIPPPFKAVQNNYQIQREDAGGLLLCGNAQGDPIDISVPLNAVEAFNPGDSITVVSWLSSVVTASGVPGVVLTTRAGKAAQVAQFGVARLVYGDNDWWVFGNDLADA